MPTIKISQHSIHVAPSNAGEERVVKNHFKAPKHKEGYRLPLTYWFMRELVKVFPTLRNVPDFVSTGKAIRGEVDRLKRFREMVVNSTDQINDKLRPYQDQDAHYLWMLRSAGVFNEPRTGKTPTIIETLSQVEANTTGRRARFLVVCPASLVYNWKNEIEKFAPELTPRVVGEKGFEFGDGVTIVSKDTLKPRYRKDPTPENPKRRVLDVEKSHIYSTITKYEWDVAVVDEAHFLRNYETDQSKAVFKLKAARKYALTGTPAVKGGQDYFGIWHFLFPDLFPSYWQFVDLFFEVGQEQYNKAGDTRPVVGKLLKHREEAFTQMLALYSTQRTRKEVMPWLPDKQRTRIEVEMSEKQRRIYTKVLKEFNFVDENGVEVDAMNALAQMTRLRQICQDPAILGLDSPSAKIDALLELIENTNEQLVVMTNHTSSLKRISDKCVSMGKRVGRITGEESSKVKQEMARLFQAGELDILLCNTVAAGVGHTLDKSNTIVFLDKPFTPAELEQAEDRVCPTQQGSNLKHNIITIVCRDSIDQRIDDILELKIDLTQYIKDGGLKAIKELLGNATKNERKSRS